MATFLILLLGAPSEVRSSTRNSACFNQAETYYEQIYCEIKAKGEGASLPAFFDFKKNNERMQALLLKRKADALRISIKMPIAKQVSNKQNHTAVPYAQPQSSSDCQYLKRSIRCNDAIYSIVSNQRNSKLKRNALDDSNKLALSPFSGELNNKMRVMDYLTKSYTRYIEKMLEIGLGGSTMSFTKFYYLFQDISSQGVNFQERFETMYAYLKKDKRSLGVRENIEAIDGISMVHCNQLKKDLFTCDNGTNNRVYVR